MITCIDRITRKHLKELEITLPEFSALTILASKIIDPTYVLRILITLIKSDVDKLKNNEVVLKAEEKMLEGVDIKLAYLIRNNPDIMVNKLKKSLMKDTLQFNLLNAINMLKH